MNLADTDSGPTPRTEADGQRAWIAFVKVLLVLPGALEAQLLRDSDLTLLGYIAVRVFESIGQWRRRPGQDFAAKRAAVRDEILAVADEMAQMPPQSVSERSAE